jgi:hypothetical protein
LSNQPCQCQANDLQRLTPPTTEEDNQFQNTKVTLELIKYGHGTSIQNNFVGTSEQASNCYSHLDCSICWCTSAYWFPPNSDAAHHLRRFWLTFVQIVFYHLCSIFSRLEKLSDKDRFLFYTDHTSDRIYSIWKKNTILNTSLSSKCLFNLIISAYFKNLPIVQKRGHTASLVCDWNQGHNIQGAASKRLDSSASHNPPMANS